jgi:hypothetical protein
VVDVESIKPADYYEGTVEYASRVYSIPSMVVFMQSTDGKKNMWMIWQGMYEQNPDISPAI